jgi:hypothetical protein
MTKIYIIFFTLWVWAQVCYCQITFQKIIGGSGFELSTGISQLNDGSYIISGRTNSFGAGNSDVYFIKLDSYGDTLWTKTYGNIKDESSWSILQTKDGGYIITGVSTSFISLPTDTENIYIIKTDSNADTLWTRTYGGIGFIEGTDAKQTSDGGYAFFASTRSFGAGGFDYYLIKTNENGDTLWTQVYGGVNDDLFYRLQQTTDKGYLISGYTYSFGAGGADAYIVKTDSLGVLQWSKTYGGSRDDFITDAKQTTDGGFIFTGYTQSYNTNLLDTFTTFVIKTNSIGDTLWIKTYGANNTTVSHQVFQSSDGNYILVGYTGHTNGNSIGSYNAYLLKIDANGDTLFSKVVTTSFSEFNAAQATVDGGMIMVGDVNLSSVDMFLVKTDSMGNSSCGQSTTQTRVNKVSMVVTNPITQQNSTQTIVRNTNTLIGHGANINTLCTNAAIEQFTKNNLQLSVYPNPNTGSFTIIYTLEQDAIMYLYDVQGKQVYSINISAEQKSVEINNLDLQNGMYMYKVLNNGTMLNNGKLIILK